MDTDCLMYEMKMSMKILIVIKKCLILLIIRLNQNTMLIQINQSLGKMKDEIGGVAIEEFVGLKSKIYSFLVENSEHKKAKDVNKMLLQQ